jgi:hypothetical protein
MANLNAYQIKQNEIFFQNVINQLKEGGFYVYPDLVTTAKDKEAPFFRKEGDILLCNKEGYNSVKRIVSAKFLLTRFKIKLQ